jgi:thiamine-monophosphate kinase
MIIGEDKLIERIRRRIPSAEGGLLQRGIGDDAAVLRPAPGADWIVTCDQFLEGVHFLAAAHPPDVVGYKALARATSDIAAMGGRPQLFLLSLALPTERTGRWLDEMLSGMARAARRFGLRLAGGDTARSAAEHPKISLSITVIGTVERGRALRRSGARAGDAIFVSGRLGAAQLGLELVLRGLHRERRFKRLLAPHYYPALALDLGQWLARYGLASAAMDISDGLSIDLYRLCQSSGMGARIHAQQIPYVAVAGEVRNLGLDALGLALDGGEDYALLFTVPQRWTARIPRSLRGTKLTRIGEIVRGRGLTLVAADGTSSPLEPGGWDHFRPGTRRNRKEGFLTRKAGSE